MDLVTREVGNDGGIRGVIEFSDFVMISYFLVGLSSNLGLLRARFTKK